MAFFSVWWAFPGFWRWTTFGKGQPWNLPNGSIWGGWWWNDLPPTNGWWFAVFGCFWEIANQQYHVVRWSVWVVGGSHPYSFASIRHGRSQHMQAHLCKPAGSMNVDQYGFCCNGFGRTSKLGTLRALKSINKKHVGMTSYLRLIGLASLLNLPNRFVMPGFLPGGLSFKWDWLQLDCWGPQSVCWNFPRVTSFTHWVSPKINFSGTMMNTFHRILPCILNFGKPLTLMVGWKSSRNDQQFAIPPTHCDQSVVVGCKFVRYSVRQSCVGHCSYNICTTWFQHPTIVASSFPLTSRLKMWGYKVWLDISLFTSTVDALKCDGEWYVWF